MSVPTILPHVSTARLTGMFAELRRALDARGIARDAVNLPGDTARPLEGALHLRDSGEGAFTLETVDYGQGTALSRTDEVHDASAITLGYLDQELPQPAVLSEQEVDALTGRAAPHMTDLTARAQERPLLVELPPGILLDRLGVLDGVHAYPYGTSFEARALPPIVEQPNARRFAFRTDRALRMRAAVTKSWFGQPGGGLRFSIAEDFVGFRDLVADGTLARVMLRA